MGVKNNSDLVPFVVVFLLLGRCVNQKALLYYENYTLSGMDIAEAIRNTVKEELGMTVSIGGSHNKVLAKLGSDMKKPDAITQITETAMESVVWPLPASDLFYCG